MLGTVQGAASSGCLPGLLLQRKKLVSPQKAAAPRMMSRKITKARKCRGYGKKPAVVRAGRVREGKIK
jgi:hypothetical protein